MPESQEQRDNAVVSSAGEPGPLSRLLQELADASGEDALETWKNELQPGDRVGRFEIRREVGRGGFGAVYEAFDTELNRVVAVKTLRLSRPRRDLSSDWIKKEAEAVARLDHPCIVTLFDVGTCDSGPYLVMELLRGKTLAQRIAEGPIPQGESLRIAEEMAKGLAHAHQRGVLHRDLKPANVFVCEDGRVKLLDFGLAHLLGTEGVSGAGTPAYMAPEQARGKEIDERADVYAAGRVLGEMIAGKLAPVDAVLAPRPVGRAVSSALSTDPALRLRDGAAWLTALQAARDALDRPRRVRRVAMLGGGFLALGLAIAVLATWRVWRRQLPAGRVTVAVADFANETGERELDSLSGLLITSLEQSRKFSVITRGRILDLAHRAGHGTVDRIDERTGRDLGLLAGASILLVPVVHRLGATYVVELRALDPERDRYLFTAREEAGTKDALLPLIDRLSDRIRRELQEPASDVVASRVEIGKAVTNSLEAYRHYSRGMDLAYQEGDPTAAREAFLRALDLDPEFAAVHLEMQDLAGGGGHRSLERAFADAERMPEKERLQILLWRGVDRRFGAIQVQQAEGIANELVSRYPSDKASLLHAARALGMLGNHLADLSALGSSEPQVQELQARASDLYRRILALDPGHLGAAAVLSFREQEAGHGGAAVEVARTAVAARPGPATYALLAQALAFDGKREESKEWARKTSEASDGSNFYSASWGSQALLANGNVDDAERELRRYLAVMRGRDVRSWSRMLLRSAGVLALQGRRREALRLLDEYPLDQRISFRGDWFRPIQAAVAAAGHHRHAAPEALRILREPSETKSSWPLTLARFGDIEAAARHATELLPGGTAELQYRDIVLASEGRLPEAIAVARVVVTKTSCCTVSILKAGRELEPDLRLAENLLASGDGAGAIESLGSLDRALARFDFVDVGCNYPRALLVRARAYERVGRAQDAVQDLDDLLALWKRADPDLPLLAEAKSMRTRLAAR